MINFIKSRKGLLVMIIVAALGWAGFQVSDHKVREVVDMVITDDQAVSQQQVAAEQEELAPADVRADFNRASVISPDRRVHILYGDATGGGHKYGVGAPCKSEFPKYWDDDMIIKEVEMIASNDNLNWEQQRNGYYVTEQKVGTVKVRVVKGRDAREVITAYPTNTIRNPCPANDN